MNKTTQKFLSKRNRVSFFHYRTGCLWLFMIALCLPALAQHSGKTLALNFTNAPLKEVFTSIETQSGYLLNYSKDEVNAGTKVTVQLKSATLKEALTVVLKSTPYGFIIEGNTVIIKARPKEVVKFLPGNLAGRVIDEENGQPVIGATIRINNEGTTSSIDGSFNLTLPHGNYTAIISSIGYGTKEVTDIEIKDNKNTELNATLKRKKGQLSTVVVKSSAKKEGVAALYVRQKNAAGITDGISAEQIGRTPDKNIAETLKRISGLSSLDNKYVVVRGLSERYNQAMMNGQMMPSTELNRKNFSYDLIPSNLVDNVIVTKTLTPDQSAEFGGGIVQINTKDIPSENSISITIGSTVNDLTTGRDFRSLKIDKSTYLGGASDDRKLFGTLNWKSQADIVNSGNFAENTADGQPLKEASLFRNNWGLYNYKPAPSYNGQLSIGRVIPFKNERQLGIIASASYRNTWQTQEVRMSRDGYYPADVLAEKAGFTGKRYGFATNVGGLAGIGFSSKKTKINLQSMYLRTLDQQFVLGSGVHSTFGETVGYYDLFSITNLWQSQLKSEHMLGNKGIKVNLALSYTQLDRQKPDNHQAIMSYLDKGEDNPQNPQSDFNVYSINSSAISAGALRSWSRALEKNLGWNADISIPFKFNVGHLPVSNMLKTGYAGWRKDRLFWVLLTGSAGFTDGTNPELLSEAFNPADGGSIYASRFGDDFHKTPSLHAGYMMMDNKIGKKLRLVWGARAEYYDLNGVNALMEKFIKDQKANNNDLTDYSDILNKEPDWNLFPSANLTFSLTPKMNIRLAYSKSIIRPDLRETTFFREYDFELGGSYWSQSPIVSTKINHLDFRYEWYPSAGEVLSFSLFYKKLFHPMEIFAKDNRLFELKNDKDAINKGLEMEVRKSFAFTGVPVLKNITLSGNFTRLFAKVRTMEIKYRASDPNNPGKLFVTELPDAEVNRPQSGASNFMYNAGFYYDAKPFSLSVSYNHIANRFYRVGNAEVGNLYEQPMNPLDVQVAVKVLKNKGMVKLNAGNLLASKYIIYTNLYEGKSLIPPNGGQPSTKDLLYQKGLDLLDYEAAPGRTYSFSFNYNF